LDKVEATVLKERDILLKDYLYIDQDLSFFEENLEKFYKHSLTELKKSNNILHYNCYNIGDPSLVNIDLFFGSQRSTWNNEGNKFTRTDILFGVVGMYLFFYLCIYEFMYLFKLNIYINLFIKIKH
jgi:hypothetical protein